VEDAPGPGKAAHGEDAAEKAKRRRLDPRGAGIGGKGGDFAPGEDFPRRHHIELAGVRNTSVMAKWGVRWMAAGYVWHSWPLLCLGLLLHGQQSYVALMVSAAGCFRTALGVSWHVKWAWLLQSSFRSVLIFHQAFDVERVEMAKASCRPYVAVMTALWASLGVVLAVGWRALEHSGTEGPTWEHLGFPAATAWIQYGVAAGGARSLWLDYGSKWSLWEPQGVFVVALRPTTLLSVSAGAMGGLVGSIVQQHPQEILYPVLMAALFGFFQTFLQVRWRIESAATAPLGTQGLFPLQANE
jgi:hypothetical protein